MIEQADIPNTEIDFVPHAVIARPISYFRDQLDGFRRDYDDLDYYEGSTFILDGKIPIALRHYDGHPPETVTIYLDGRIRDRRQISDILRRIVEELRVEDAVKWQRDDDWGLNFVNQA